MVKRKNNSSIKLASSGGGGNRPSVGDGGGGPKVHSNGLDDCYPLNKLCRLCLLSNANMEPIFAYIGDIELSQRIFQCTGLEIHENEDKGIPTSICGQCRRQLDQCYEFRTLCWKNNDVLHNLNLLLSPRKERSVPTPEPTMMSAIPIVQVEKLKFNPSLLPKSKHPPPKPKGAEKSSKIFGEISLKQLFTPNKRGRKTFKIPNQFSRDLVVCLTPMSPALLDKYRKTVPKPTQTKAAVKSFPQSSSRVEKKSSTPQKLTPIKIKIGKPKSSKTEKSPPVSAKKSKAKTDEISVPPKKRKDNFQPETPEAKVLTISCTLCTQTFSNMKNLSRHTAAHENNRKQNRVFNCDICHKEYLKASQLTDHLRSAEHVSNAASNAPDEGEVSILPDEQSILPDTNISTTVASPTVEVDREVSPNGKTDDLEEEADAEKSQQTPKTIRQLSPISVGSDSPLSDGVQYSDVCSTNNDESLINSSAAKRVSFAEVTEILG